MHAISAVQYYALRCNALHCLPTTMERFMSHKTYIHACIIHEPKSQRAYANALDKDSPPPHNRPNYQTQSLTTLPVTNGQSKNNNPCDRIAT